MTETAAAQPKSRPQLAWVVGWALAVGVLLAGYGQAALRQEFSEPDNAMRLVEVRNWLGGQGWFDMVEHRLNPPDGVLMHWARWIDALIGIPVMLLTPLLGAQGAEIAVAFVYPFALLAAFIWLAVEVAGEIGASSGLRGEARIAGAVVAALAFPAIEKFSPGSFDHHNVELVLTFLSMLALIRMSGKPWLGAVAGAALGVAMGTAAEGAPFVAIGLLVAGLLWLFQPKTYARGLAWMGAGLGAAALVSFLALAPPSRWGQPVCDAMSTPFLGFGIAGGVVAGVLGLLPVALVGSLVKRLVVAGVLGGAAMVALLVLFPGCAGGGYSGVSADMTTLWMAQISESRSLIQLTGDDPALLMGMAGAALAGLVAAAFYLRTRWKEPAGWIVLAFLVAGWALMAWQIRGTTFATACAIPFGAWAVARSRVIFRASPTALRALAFGGVAVTSAAAAWAGVGDFAQKRLLPHATMASYETRVSSARDCSRPQAFAPLTRVPAGVILNHFSLGPSVLLRTNHSVIAAPYHRNGKGTMAMINAMRSDPAAARQIIAETGADYVLVCPALPEARFYAQHPAPGTQPEATLAAMLQAGTMPAWLAPMDTGASPLKLYRVIK
jgi:hypothetical protein